MIFEFYMGLAIGLIAMGGVSFVYWNNRLRETRKSMQATHEKCLEIQSQIHMEELHQWERINAKALNISTEAIMRLNEMREEVARCHSKSQKKK